MQKLLFVTLLSAGLANAAGHQETRELSLDAAKIVLLEVDAGAGSLKITGEPGRSVIAVTATIRTDERDLEKARGAFAEDIVLTLQESGERAVLQAKAESGFWNRGDGLAIDLVVRMPERLSMAIDDGSGGIEINSIKGDVSVDDGSGEIAMADIGGNVTIDDGSGAVTVSNVGGNLSITDGSGNIRVRQVSGSVTVDDGSGGIDVRDVSQDLTIVNDGTGSLKFSDIKGKVDAET